MYCKCKEPKTVDVIIQNKKHIVCSKRLGGCGEEYKPDVVTGKNAKMFLDGVEIGQITDVTYNIDFDYESLGIDWDDDEL